MPTSPNWHRKNRWTAPALLLVLGICSPARLPAQGYMFFTGGGGGGSAGAGSFGVEGGKILARGDGKFFLGGSLGVAFNGRSGGRTGAFLETRIRNEQELYGAAGIRLQRRLYLVGTAGLADQSARDIIRVPGAPKVVEEYPLNTFVTGSGQLRFVFKRVVLGAGYHSRRGLIAGLGFTF